MATPFRVQARLPDLLEFVNPPDQAVGGFLGARIGANATNRLLKVDEAPLLAGFRHKPGSHPWIGEHVGKWMHATTLAWAVSGSPALREKLDRVAADLIQAQEPDGYLGTYVPEKRFGLYPEADWDVWSHKYNLMGLLTYHQYTGNPAALEVCRRMGDLLVRTFGPGRKSILSAGTHVGMAATSVLEPMVLLYRFTGDERYLEFARYLVGAYDEPGGPRIVATLRELKSVQKTANGKAYEMLSNLVGLCELARVTGDRSLLEAVLNGWADVVANRLYLTGSASQGEHFHGDHDLPNRMSSNVAETCVTTTWIQLNSQLLRLTGEARFGDELERTFYNHLAAAQRPDGAQWCYFTALEGLKPYGPGINCCVSSGPRSMALAALHGFFRFRMGPDEGLAMNLFEPARAQVEVQGQRVGLRYETRFPAAAGGVLRVSVAGGGTARFALRVRAPQWALPLELRLSGATAVAAPPTGGWAEIPARDWHDGDQVRVRYSLAATAVPGEYGNAGRTALRWGPFVLAYDQKLNPELPPAGALSLAFEPGRPPFRPLPGAALRFTVPVRSAQHPKPSPVLFVPFAEAGASGGAYRVWLRSPGASLPQQWSLLAEGKESRSRPGNRDGSINDGDPGSFVVTYDGKTAEEAWFAVALTAPATVRRVVFAHGQSFHDGGWFDCGAGKPRVQVRRAPSGPWETVGELGDYPAATAQDGAGLKPGDRFSVKLSAPVTVTAVRVIGKPASGDNPRQAFASCGEFEAFGD